MSKIHFLLILVLGLICITPQAGIASVTPPQDAHIEPGVKPAVSTAKKQPKVHKKHVSIRKQKAHPAPEHIRKQHENGKKSFLIALLLCVIGGYLGLHRFYLGYPVLGTIYFFTGGILLIGWIIDMFLFKAEKLHPKGKKDFDTI